MNIFLNFLQMNTALQQQRLEVEQLRREAAMKRIPVSQAVEDIKVIFSYKSLYILQLRVIYFLANCV